MGKDVSMTAARRSELSLHASRDAQLCIQADGFHPSPLNHRVISVAAIIRMYDIFSFDSGLEGLGFEVSTVGGMRDWRVGGSKDWLV